MLDDIPAQPGTYLLIFHSDTHANTLVGRLGALDLVPGYYFYIGSAFGPGGIRARVRHHHGISKRPHWHLDYIRPHLSLQEVCYSPDRTRYEHVWAESLYYTMKMQIPMPRLGASDCKCESHFFYSKTMPGHGMLKKVLMKNKEHVTLEMVRFE